MRDVDRLPEPLFGGATYSPERDGCRLRGQLELVAWLMRDGAWWTIPALAARVGCSQTSASARIRDLRKPKFGGHTIERQYVTRGVWRYRMVRP